MRKRCRHRGWGVNRRMTMRRRLQNLISDTGSRGHIFLLGMPFARMPHYTTLYHAKGSPSTCR